MSDENTNKEPSALESAEMRLESLNRQVHERANAKQRRQNILLVLGMGLSLLCIFAFTRITVQGRGLDAEAITQIGRLELQKRLPATMDAIQTRLEKEAPYLVRDGLNRVVKLLPRFRSYIVQEVNSRLDTLNSDFEKRILAVMADQIHTTKCSIDVAYPNLGDREKLEFLVEEVSKNFNKSFLSIMDSLYPKYASEMTRVRYEFVDLVKKKEADLTREERIKKEILITMVRLAKRSNKGIN